MLGRMNPTLADARLKNMTAWDCAPKLTQEDITMLLQAARRTDNNGNPFTDPTWIASFDLDWAAREAWAWKAGAAADHYRLVDGNIELDRNQVYDHCLKMFNLYDKKAMGRPQSLRATGNLVEDRLGFNPTPWWLGEASA